MAKQEAIRIATAKQEAIRIATAKQATAVKQAAPVKQAATVKQGSNTNVIKTIDTNMINLELKKVAVCVGGYVSESLKYTKNIIKSNILEKLNSIFNVDVFVVAPESKKDNIDTVFNEFNVKYVELIDEEVLTSALNKYSLSEDTEYKKIVQELVIENTAYNYIVHQEQKNNSRYDCIIYIRPDMFPAKSISLSEVNKTVSNKDSVYSCNFNDWDGYGVGYYIGSHKTIQPIMTRIKSLTSKISSEKLMKQVMESAKLTRYKSNMFYFKVKPTGGPDVYYQLLKKYTTSKEYMDTKEAFQNSVAPLRKNKVIAKTDEVLSFTVKTSKTSKTKTRKHKRRSCPN